jgi:hypothetical protein
MRSKVARSNLAVPARAVLSRRRGRRPQPEAELLAEINQTIAGQPTYGYRRVHALIRRRRQQQGGAAVNVKTRLPDHEDAQVAARAPRRQWRRTAA